MRQIILFTCIFIIVFLTYSFNDFQNNQNRNFEIIECKDYSIQYNKSLFDLRKDPYNDSLFFLFTKKDKPKDNYSEVLKFVAENIEKYKSMNLDYYIQLREYTIQSNSKIIESKRVKKPNHDYHSIIYQRTNSLNDTFKICERIYLKNEKVYTLAYHSLKKDYFTHYYNIEAVMESFKIK